MEQTFVSVIVPVFNHAAVLDRAIASILSQSFGNFELIVIDDGSHQPAVASDDPRVRMLRHDRNLGAGAARNTGIAAAAGRYIAFLDADDVWHPDKFETQLECFNTAPPDIRACFCHYTLKREAGNGWTSRIVAPMPLRPSDPSLLWGCNVSPGSTMIVHRACFEDVGPFDEALRALEDWDWLLRFNRRYAAHVVPRVLATVYAHPMPRSRSRSTLAALALLNTKFAEQIAATGSVNLRKFRSTLMVERAAHYRRVGQIVRAIMATMRAISIYPFRNYAFYRQIVGTLLTLCARNPT